MLAEPATPHRIESAIRMDRLFDRALIAETLAHPRIYPHISDDFSPPPDEADTAINDAAIYLGAFRGDSYLGLFLLHAHNGVLFEVHTCLLPAAWGDNALACASGCITWAFQHTPCRRLITSVPTDNPLAHRLAVRAGMSEFGRNPRSILRGGQLLDQVLLGISKD
jgi:RimJ/RimL family protein N-acetyltransferase